MRDQTVSRNLSEIAGPAERTQEPVFTQRTHQYASPSLSDDYPSVQPPTGRGTPLLTRHLSLCTNQRKVSEAEFHRNEHMERWQVILSRIEEVHKTKRELALTLKEKETEMLGGVKHDLVGTLLNTLYLHLSCYHLIMCFSVLVV